MALVDDDVAEVVLGVVSDQERRGGIAAVHVKRLVGRDEDSRVLLRVAARNGRRVGPELVLEGHQCLASELITVADEQGPTELAGIADLPEELDRDVSLPGPGRERQERALLTTGQLLEHRADRRILVVAPRSFAARVAHEQWPGERRFECEPHCLFVAGAEVGRRREFGKWSRGAGDS